MFSTHQKGVIAELKVQLRAAELGIIVSCPTTEARYDLVLDIDGKLCRAQVKYAGSPGKANVSNSITVATSRDTRNNRKKRPYTSDEVDVILAFVPTLERILWVPPDIFTGKTSLSFRTAPAKNGQTQGTRLAEDFFW